MTPVFKKLKRLEVVGKSGKVYVVPREVFDLVPPEHKRMVVDE